MALNAEAVAQIPLPQGKTNLNAGTLSPTPLPVLRRAEELRLRAATNPSDFCWRQIPGLVQASRKALAGYLNCRPDELLLIPNVTFAINLVVSSLQLPAGTEVLLTDHEYGSMVYAWQRFAGLRDWSLRTLNLPAGRETTKADLIRRFEEAMTPSTRVLFLYHCTSPSGLVFPLREICAMARERSITTVVDGAHAPGMIPVDLSEIGADFYGSNTHKWLMGPNNGGFLHVARTRRLDVKPLVTAWGWPYNRSEAFDDSGNGGSKWQWDLEFHGTADRVPQMVMPEALAFRDALGGEAAIRAHTRSLAQYARKKIPLPCATPDDPELSGALTIFDVPKCDATKARDQMYFDHHIEAPVSNVGDRQFLRVSTAVFNDESDIDRLAAAVKKVFG